MPDDSALAHLVLPRLRMPSIDGAVKLAVTSN